MPFVKYEQPNNSHIKICNSPEHNPPGMIVLEPGTHTYECPNCGRLQTIIIPEKSW